MSCKQILPTLEQALQTTLLTLEELVQSHQVKVSANMILSDGHRLIASRFATGTESPSLYWLDDPAFPEAVCFGTFI